jgi:hypothetical protein
MYNYLRSVWAYSGNVQRNYYDIGLSGGDAGTGLTRLRNWTGSRALS